MERATLFSLKLTLNKWGSMLTDMANLMFDSSYITLS